MDDKSLTAPVDKKASLLAAMAARFGMEPNVLFDTLKGTIMKADKDGRVPSNEEMVAFLIVANKYQLNPFTKEIYAFPDKRAGVVPIISTDGWSKLMVSHENYKTHSFRYADKNVDLKDAKSCPEWCECDIEKKDGSHVVIREYLDEVYRPAFEGKGGYKVDGPWQSHTKRMLRHKVKIQAAREAFGFSGIYDEDEAERIIEIQGNDPSATKPIVSIKGKELPQAPASTPASTQEPTQDATSAPQEGKDSTPPADNAPGANVAKTSAFQKNIDKVRASLVKSVGEKKAKELILNTLGTFGYESVEMIPNAKIQNEFIETLIAKYQAIAESK